MIEYKSECMLYFRMEVEVVYLIPGIPSRVSELRVARLVQTVVGDLMRESHLPNDEEVVIRVLGRLRGAPDEPTVDMQVRLILPFEQAGELATWRSLTFQPEPVRLTRREIQNLRTLSSVTRYGVPYERHDCIICMESVLRRCMLPCRHVFHFRCLVDWLSTKRSCPSCRTAVDLTTTPRARRRAARRRLLEAQMTVHI